MRVVLRSLAILAIVLAMVPMAQAGAAAAQPEMVNTGDELVIITNTGRLETRDPYTPPGIRPVAWQSPETGFTHVATGDFNGDGSDEVVGLRGGEAVVYDPVPLPGEPSTDRVFPATTGQTWRNVTTGDLDGDGSDELVLAESSGSGTVLNAFKFNASTGWNQTFSNFYGAPWVGLATGDMMGNRRDQVVGIRNVGSSNQIIIFNPANNWQTVNEFTRTYPWVSVAVGDVTLDGAGKEEIVVTRTGVGAALPSMFVFRWEAQFSDLQDQEREVFNPEFRWIALANVNATSNSQDKEVFLLRNTAGAGQAAVTSRNYGNDQGTPVFNELLGQTQWNGIQAGDVDGDGNDEVIIMSPSAYLIYTQPNANTASVSFPGSYSSTGNFAVGNLDGPGLPEGPTLAVSPLTVNLTVQAGQNSSQPINITNTGTGTLNWTATVVDGSAWLSMSATNGTAPSTLQLLINTGSLAANTYVGHVRIDGAAGTSNSPQTVTVNLTVTAPPNPTLTVSPLTVDLTLQAGQNASEPIDITNSGAGTLSWTATVVDGSSWLSMSPSSGIAPSTPQLLISTSAVAPGQYVGHVRIDGAAGTSNSPQTITVNLTVTAPQFLVQPNVISWFYQPPINPGVRTVTLSGQNVAWHAGVVPMSVAAQVEQAVAAGQPVKLQGGQLVIGEGANAEAVPIVDWIDVNPVTGVATPGGVFVDLTLVLDRVPYGLNSAAVVFVADIVASPPAVVVRASALRSLPNATDLLFLPLIVHGP